MVTKIVGPLRQAMPLGIDSARIEAAGQDWSTPAGQQLIQVLFRDVLPAVEI